MAPFYKRGVMGLFSSVSKAFKDVTKAVSKPIRSVTKDIPLVGDATKTILDVNNEITGRVVDVTIGKNSIGAGTEQFYNKNKDGIDGAVGLLGRGAAAYYTFGASELVGGGDKVTKQFGTNNDFAKYGKVAGAVGGIAGAGALAKGASWLGASGAGTTAATTAKTLQYANVATGKGAPAQSFSGASRAPASVTPQGEKSMGNGLISSYWDSGNEGLNAQIDKYGGEVLNATLGKLFGNKDEPKPVSNYSNTAPAQASDSRMPAGFFSGSDDNMKMMMLGGFGLLALILAVKK